MNDQGCQHVMGSFESFRVLLSKQTGWSTFVKSHRLVKTAERFKKQLSPNFPPIGREKIVDLCKSWGIVPLDKMNFSVVQRVVNGRVWKLGR